MKRTLTLLIALALLLGLAVPALAEGPECLIATDLMRNYIFRLPDTFEMLANPDPSAAMTKYMLSEPEMAGDSIKFANEDGTVVMVARGGERFIPTTPANDITFTIAGSVNAFDTTALKLAFLGAVSDLDPSVTYEDLVAWMPEASADSGSIDLNGYTLSFSRNSDGEQLALTAGASVAAPAPAATEAPAAPAPAPEGTGELPRCFIPQEASQYYNGMLGPMLEMLGAPDPGALAERLTLTKASIEGSVLYLSNAEGTVEMNAYFEDGQPALDKQATTLGIALANPVDRSELMSVGATFSYMVMDMDDSITDFEPMLDWMGDAVDGGKAAILPLNGYMLAYANGDNGSIFTLVPDTANGGGQDVSAPVETEPTEAPAPEPTEAPTPEPTEAPTPEPTAEPTPEPNLPQSLDGAVLNWNGVSVKPVKFSVHTYSGGDATLWIHFQVLNNTDQAVHVQADDVTVNGEKVYGGTLGTYDPYTDTGADPEDFLLIMADSNNKDAGLRAIENASTVKLTLVVKDEGYNKLCTETVTLDLDDMKGERDKPRDVVDSNPEPEQKKSSSADYRTLSKGDKGDDVKRLQQKLIELGYLNDVADGEYGPKTAAAVKALNEANGLGSSSSADAVTQDMVFSGLANPYTEPWMPVDFPYLQWDRIDVDGASYRVKITNTSKTKTIKGIALQYYVTDVWGNKPWGSMIYREFTDTMTIKPGETKYSMWWYMTPAWSSIDQVHIRASRIAFDDGEVRERTDDNYDTYFTLH